MKDIFQQKIIDCHHHLWDFNLNIHNWLKENQNIKFHRSYLVNDLTQDIGDLKIIKTVHVQAEINRNYSLYETEWLQNISNSRNDKFPNAIMAYIDLSMPDIESIIVKHKEFKNFRGFRQILRLNENEKDLPKSNKNYLKNESWIQNMSYLQKYDLIFELLCYYNQYEDAAKIINKYQYIKFIINHTLWPEGINKSNFEIWQKGIDKLSSFPNTYIKFSAFGELFPNWTKNIIKPFIDYSFNKFGVERCLFGSNFPVDKFISSSSYLNYWKSYYEIMNELTSEELNKIFYQNAEKVYCI